jgi:hypothetical protein
VDCSVHFGTISTGWVWGRSDGPGFENKEPRRLFLGGFGAGLCGEGSRGNNDRDENHGNQKVIHFVLLRGQPLLRACGAVLI